MQEADRKQFWIMVNVSMDLTNHPPLNKESIIGWWHKLKHLDFNKVQLGFDKWLDSSNKPPTPKDILDLCRNKEEFYTALPNKNSKDKYAELSSNVIEFINLNSKEKTDYKAWAKNIIANPNNYPSISLKYANDALNN